MEHFCTFQKQLGIQLSTQITLTNKTKAETS